MSLSPEMKRAPAEVHAGAEWSGFCWHNYPRLCFRLAIARHGRARGARLLGAVFRILARLVSECDECRGSVFTSTNMPRSPQLRRPTCGLALYSPRSITSVR